MSTGRIEQVGTPVEVYDRPATPFVMEFLGDVNRLPGVVHAGDGPDGPRPTYVRPHDIGLTREPRVDGAPGLEAVVRGWFIRGPGARVELEHVGDQGRIEAQISRARLEELALREGETIFVELLKPQNVPAVGSI